MPKCVSERYKQLARCLRLRDAVRNPSTVAGSEQIACLAAQFKVSSRTIRRDLAFLVEVRQLLGPWSEKDVGPL